MDLWAVKPKSWWIFRFMTTSETLIVQLQFFFFFLIRFVLFISKLPTLPMLQFNCGFFFNGAAVFHASSERDWHAQAVEKHRASFEKSHADCLPARSVQVCLLLRQSTHDSCRLSSNDQSFCVCRGFLSLLPLFSLQWEQMQQMEEKECGALRGTTHSAPVALGDVIRWQSRC